MGEPPAAATLFDDFLFETLHECHDLTLFGLWHLEFDKSCGGVAEEHAPIAFADAHAPVTEGHISAAVVHRSARTRAQKVNQQLLLAIDAVFPPVRPEAAELGIGPESGQEVIRHRRDRVVTTEALVQGLRVTQRILLESPNCL